MWHNFDIEVSGGSNQKLKILLVEDHAFLRESIAQVLGEIAEDVKVVQAENASEAMEILRRNARFDLVMLDLALGGQDGLGCLQAIRQHSPAVPVLVVSAYDDATTIQRVRAGGALGFVPKRFSGDVLKGAVKNVLAGEPFWPSIGGGSQTEPNSLPRQKIRGRGIAAKSYGLTPRQMKVLELLVAGRSNREIGQLLSVCEGTIKVHMNNIFKILGVKSRAQAIVAVSEFGIRFES